ncbi:hypothetical protein P4O66_015131, partial [Electrophorus voltai]
MQGLTEVALKAKRLKKALGFR